MFMLEGLCVLNLSVFTFESVSFKPNMRIFEMRLP